MPAKKRPNSPKPEQTTEPAPVAAPAGQFITIRGARQNNLRSIDLDIPLGKFNVITGPSGSGKSSLAIDTIYAEGQRRYVETFSPYTRQFFDRMNKPQVEEIRGIPPAVAIEQQNNVRTTRSTVGTMTEINDYLKLLFPRLATGVCSSCGEPVKPDSASSIARLAAQEFAGRAVLVTIPVPCPPATLVADFFVFLQAQGYLRVWLFGKVYRTDEPAAYERKTLPAVVPVVQDRITIAAGKAGNKRLTEALETALRLGKGKLNLIDAESGKLRSFSTGWHCAACDVTLREPSPALFSFNSPLGACQECRGFGRTIGLSLDRAMPDKSLSIKEGLVKAFSGTTFSESQTDLEKASKRRGLSLTVPYDEMDKEDQQWIVNGEPGYQSNPEEAFTSGQWYGVKGFFDWLEKRSYKMHYRVFLSRFRNYTDCRVCQGTRLRPESLLYRVDGMMLPEWWRMPVGKLSALISGLTLPPLDATAELLRKEVVSRLSYLEKVGLGYLNLDRSTRTLSGGETERVNLTTCLGASLVNTLFVLDEPSVGLHPRDTGRLIEIMRQLTDRGNTLLVVEHEESVIRAADNLIDIGPGRGEEGGQLVFHGHPSKLPKMPGKSLTADYLHGRKWIRVPETRRPVDSKRQLKIHRATQHNLNKLDVNIPLGLFVCITGVSGSGKSTLVHDVLYENLLRLKGGTSENEPGACKSLAGAELVNGVVMVDQSALSRTPRSTPAVYVGAFEYIRQIMAETDDGVAEEITAGYFSFNSGTGRCDRCSGMGFEKVEMQFLSDLFVPCSECEGRRYKDATQRIRYQGLSISEILDLTITEAILLFATHAATDKKCKKTVDLLERISSVGLGYLKLGQPLNTLSGGESQRLKLVGHLLENSGKNIAAQGQTNLLIFDEPTTGLHFDDIALLMEVFQELVEAGNSLIVVEHNTNVVACADWVIDLGPEAGEDGGRLVIAGTPEAVAECSASHTGMALLEMSLPTVPIVEIPAKPVPASENVIRIHGAREHNLKNINVTIPRDKFVVVTGLSGSGKSTLAFDLVFAEGQRRFLDSMSTYARQFVDQLERPDVDHISGLPPTVAIEQRISRGGAKSTVATVTEVYHFLRLLYSKVGTQHCPKCQVPVQEQTGNGIARSIRAALKKEPLRIMVPIIRGRKGFHDKIADQARRLGAAELYIDGKLVRVDDFTRLARFKEHHIDIVLGLADTKTAERDLEQLVNKALELGRGVLRVMGKSGRPEVYSSDRTCPECRMAFDVLDPRLFSFNSPHGWCPDCRGYGFVKKGKSYLEEDRAHSLMEAELLEEQRMEGLEADEIVACGKCNGSRLNPVANAVQLQGRTLGQLSDQPVSQARQDVMRLKFTGSQEIITQDIKVEIEQRLKFLEEVGLGYLSLNRSATTLSGGESQRIRLAAQLGSNLRGVLYVLDEPTIGLHPRDNERLLQTMLALRDKGNSLLVVEHDEETMLAADHIIDLGPGAGRFGGRIVAEGTPAELLANKESVTGPFLRPELLSAREFPRRPLPAANAEKGWIRLKGATANNLKNVDISIPVGRLTVLSGISGSGKSSLMRGSLLPAVQSVLSKIKQTTLPRYKSISGLEQLEAVYEVDQSPIGKTSRSTPATYLKLYDDIRALFAATPEARARGYAATRFSFNTEGGRCATCGGNGMIKHEMMFLPSSYTQCEDCHGSRYNSATLEITYNGKTIGEVCQLSVDEACEFFTNVAKIRRPLELLRDTGVGYLQLGQASPTLSGGEAQRLKLVTELSRGEARADNTRLRKNQQPKSNLYLIEEPTIGLHPADVRKLINLIHRLVGDGHTVIVIEHHLELIASADYVIDVGPEAGGEGGTIVAAGTPEVIAKCKQSQTGKYLAKLLRK